MMLLGWLELRRGLRAPLSIGFSVVLLLMLLAGGRDDLARQNLWTTALVLLSLAAPIHAAGLIPRWRAGEADWLGSRPVSRAPTLLVAWGGGAAASLVLLLLGAFAIQLRCGSPEAPARLIWAQDLEEVERLDGGDERSLRLDVPTTKGGERLRVRVMPTVGGDPTTDLHLLVARDGGGTEATVRVATRTWVETEVPSGSTPLILQLVNVGTGSAAWLAPRSIELWAPVTSSWVLPLTSWWRAACLLLALTALSVGLSAWMRGATAAGAALCVFPAGHLLDAPSWVPGRGIVPLLESVGEGRIPDHGGWPGFVATLVTVAVGLALARPGLASWRHGR